MVVSRRIGILFPSLRIFFSTSICTTSDPFHEQFVLAAVKAGKPVFCEKPLAPTPEACRRIHRSQFDLRIIAALARNISAPPDPCLPARTRIPPRPQWKSYPSRNTTLSSLSPHLKRPAYRIQTITSSWHQKKEPKLLNSSSIM